MTIQQTQADDNDSMIKGILIGALAGAALGAAVGWAYSSAMGEAEEQSLALNPGDYFKLGIALLTVARQVGDVTRRV
ncbi:MAG: hypothetical protein U9R25_07265 [Chloroflexota bacterium]|nr:hypothetical protein [Chloroflexota bacterium]